MGSRLGCEPQLNPDDFGIAAPVVAGWSQRAGSDAQQWGLRRDETQSKPL